MIHLVFALSIITLLLDISSGVISYALFKWQKIDSNKRFSACCLGVTCMVAMYLISAYGTVSDIAQTRPASSVFFYLGNAGLPIVWYAIFRSLHLFLSATWDRAKRAAYAAITAVPPLLLFGSLLAPGAAGKGLETLYEYAFDAQSLVFLFICARYRGKQPQKRVKAFLDAVIAVIACFVPLFLLEDALPTFDAFYASLGLTWPSFILYQFFVAIAGIRFALGSLSAAIPKTPPKFSQGIAPEPDADPLRGRGLSRREIDVAILLLERRSYKEIAESLFISMPTVKSHAHHIFKKIGVRTRAELREAVGTPKAAGFAAMDARTAAEPARAE